MNWGKLGLTVSASLKWMPREDLDVRREGKIETCSIKSRLA